MHPIVSHGRKVTVHVHHVHLHGVIEPIGSHGPPVQRLMRPERSRPMHQIQVNVAETEVGNAAPASRLHLVRLVVGVPQLRDHKQVLALHGALVDLLLQRVAHLLLVFVQEGGVKVTVASVDGIFGCRASFLVQRLIKLEKRAPRKLATKIPYLPNRWKNSQKKLQ